MKIIVELDVFSGRPNPVWALTTEESTALMKQLSALPLADKNKKVMHDGLGYRGFILSLSSTDDMKKSPSAIYIFDGTVLMNGQLFIDTNAIEKKLVAQAREKGYAAIIESLQIKG